MRIEGSEETGYQVNCPNEACPKTDAKLVRKNYKVIFNLKICKNCPFKDNCPTKRERNEQKGTAIFRFSKADEQRQRRHTNIKKIPVIRRGLRSGVENLMARFHRCAKHTGKLKVTGLFNMKFYVFLMGVVINSERIFAFKNA